MIKSVPIFILIFSFGSFTQTLLNETFSNFTPDTTGIYGYFNMDSTSNDSIPKNLALSGDGDNASIIGWADLNALMDSVKTTVGNPNKIGGTALHYNSSGKFLRANNTAGHFEPRTGDATIAVMWYYIGGGATYGILGKGGTNPLIDKGYQFLRSGSNVHYLVSDGSVSYFLDATEPNNTGWNINLLSWDRDDGIRAYTNGILSDSVISSNTVDITNPNWFFYMGKDGANSNNTNDWAAIYLFAEFAFSKKQAKEWGFLANNWVSVNGGVTRLFNADNYLFHQGVSGDTIYFDSLLTVGEWSVDIDVDGQNGGEAYQILSSGDKVNWTNIGSGSAPANSTTKTFNGNGLGYFGISVSPSDTVYFDDIQLILAKTDNDPGFDGFPKKTPGFPKFP